MNDDTRIDELGDRLERSVAAEQRATRSRERRARRRPLVLGLAATGVAAVGVAAVLVTGSGSGSAGTRAPAAGGPGLPAATGHTGLESTAYIIKRVKAKLATDADGTVLHDYTVPGGSETSSGALSDSGHRSYDQYVYDTPNGDQYQRTTFYDASGDVSGISFWRITTPAGGRQTLTATRIDPATHTYVRSQTLTGGGATIGATVPHGESAVEHALASGRLTQLGTTTIDGTPAIALSFKEIRVGSHVFPVDTLGYTETLYVDAQSYEPLSMVAANPTHDPRYFRGLLVSDYLPVTQANIATAEDESIPAGDTRAGSR